MKSLFVGAAAMPSTAGGGASGGTPIFTNPLADLSPGPPQSPSASSGGGGGSGSGGGWMAPSPVSLPSLDGGGLHYNFAFDFEGNQQPLAQP